MLGMMYALVAVGFTLFFGVLNVIKFSHGDVLTVGAFTALATYVGLTLIGLQSHWLALVVMLVVATMAMAFLGVLIARYLVMPLRSAPALNTLLITLMLGTVLRECVRLFYPQGANPKPFPALLPRGSIDLGAFNLRFDNVLMLAAGVLTIVRRHHPYVSTLALVAAVIDLRQHYDWQPHAPRSGALVQLDAARRLPEAVRGQLCRRPGAHRRFRAGTFRPHVRTGRRPADDRPPPHRDLPGADKRAQAASAR
jgi:hypothetical protein